VGRRGRFTGPAVGVPWSSSHWVVRIRRKTGGSGRAQAWRGERADPGARQAERAEDGAEEAEATQTAEATRWGRGGFGRPAVAACSGETGKVAAAMQEREET
jgi:uncharacterized protein YgiB involved in biofilm formation